MVLRYLLDEHLRGGGLWQALQQHNALGGNVLDAIRVGYPSNLPLGTLDPDVLLWAENEGRIFVSLDKRTLPGHLANHLQSGHHSPGVFIIRPKSTIPQVLAYLEVAAYAADPDYFKDRIESIP